MARASSPASGDMTQGQGTREVSSGGWGLASRRPDASRLPAILAASRRSGGLVLTALLVPAGIGYVEASGLPAIYGLYATIVPLVMCAVVGPSRILVLGPDSSLAPLIAAAILPLAAGSDAEAVALAGMLAFRSRGSGASAPRTPLRSARPAT